MKILLIPAATIAIATIASAETETFDKASTGSVPAALTCGVTGRGSPKWTIEADPTAPSQPNVLKQSGSGTFPWCVWKGGSITDGYAEVKFKPLEGREDQAGGGRMALEGWQQLLCGASQRDGKQRFALLYRERTSNHHQLR
jgi:hypothetical protein